MQALTLSTDPWQQQLHEWLKNEVDPTQPSPAVDWPFGTGFVSAVCLGSGPLLDKVLRQTGLNVTPSPFNAMSSNPAMVAHALEDGFKTLLDTQQVPPSSTEPWAHPFYRDRFGAGDPLLETSTSPSEAMALWRKDAASLRSWMARGQRTLFILMSAKDAPHSRSKDIQALSTVLKTLAPTSSLLVLRTVHKPMADPLDRVRVRRASSDCVVLSFLVNEPSNGLEFPDARDQSLLRRLLGGLGLPTVKPPKPLDTTPSGRLKQQLHARLEWAARPQAERGPAPTVDWTFGTGFRSAVSLGGFCHAAQALLQTGLRHAAGPFDWVFSNPGMVAHALHDGFKTFLDPTQFEPVPPEQRTHPQHMLCHHRFYRDRFGVQHVFNHRSPEKPEVAAYLARAAERLLARMARDERTLFVIMGLGWCNPERYQALRRTLKAMAPSSALLILHLVHQPTTRGGPRVGVRLAEPDCVALNLQVFQPSDGVVFTDTRDTAMLDGILRSLDVAQAPPPRRQGEFDEAWYRQRHPDVAQAIRDGLFESGWQHYLRNGRQEGRKARRLQKPMLDMPEHHEPISLERHGRRTWHRFKNLHFAAGDRAVPLTLQEVPRTVLSLPMAFVLQDDVCQLVAMVGLQEGENLMVEPGSGRWLSPYLPAKYRAFPFAMGPGPNGQAVLCIHETLGLASEDNPGEPLFDEQGQPTQTVRDVATFLTQIGAQRHITQTACDVLWRSGVLEPWALSVPGEPEPQPITGFYRVNETKLNEVAPQTLAELRQAGALPLAYAQLFSMSHLPGLLALHRKRQEAMAATLPTDAAGDLNLDFLSQDGTLKLGGLF